MKTSFAAFCIVLFATSAVHAQTGSVKLELSADSATSSKAKGNVEMQYKVEEGQKTGTALLEIEATGEASKASTTDAGVLPQVTNVEPQTSRNASDFRLSEAVSISAVTVRGWDATKKQEFLATGKTHAQVQSDQDLERFAEGVLLKDEAIENIDYDDTHITVFYKGKAKLFGFIAFPYTHHVTIDTDAQASDRVIIQLPWYRFLLKTGIDAESMETAIAVDLRGELSSNDVSARISAYANALSTVATVLKKKHEIAKNTIGNVR